jgi:hypothetical protein
VSVERDSDGNRERKGRREDWRLLARLRQDFVTGGVVDGDLGDGKGFHVADREHPRRGVDHTEVREGTGVGNLEELGLGDKVREEGRRNQLRKEYESMANGKRAGRKV